MLRRTLDQEQEVCDVTVKDNLSIMLTDCIYAELDYSGVDAAQILGKPALITVDNG